MPPLIDPLGPPDSNVPEKFVGQEEEFEAWVRALTNPLQENGAEEIVGVATGEDYTPPTIDKEDEE
jgi:hypothetical protein